MNYHKGFAAMPALLIALGIIIVGGVGYVALNPQSLKAPVAETTEVDDGVQSAPGDHPEQERSATDGMVADSELMVTWRYADLGEIDGMPYTKVTVLVNGTAYETGKYMGSCSEIGATGGIDGKGLLAGELSATQCWFAGGGDEIGVFAHEDGGFDIMIGELGEGAEGGAGMFRGNFKVQTSIAL